MDINISINSLPTEIICEIGKNIELPEDAVRFSLACREFYECRNVHLLKWISNMRSIIKEINKIDYESDINIQGFEVSYRKYNGIKTGNYLHKINVTLEVIQTVRPENITRFQLKRFKSALFYTLNPKTRRTNVVLSHNAFNKRVKCESYTLFYDNLIL